MPIYRPRAFCRLHVPPFGDAGASRDEAIELPIRPRQVTIEYNDHNHADTASISVDWRDAGVDPRFLNNATAHIYVGNANGSGVFVPTDETLRFVGVMTRPKRVAKEGSGFQVDLEFHDYTELFLSQKPFPTAGLPGFSETLFGAWQKICDHTGPLDEEGEVLSSVAVLRDRLEFRGGVDPETVLGGAVARRFSKLSAVPAKDKTDAWAVWQQCVGMLGLISFIELDRCVVTTTTEHFAPEDAPKLVWGKNILELEEETNAKFSDKGVAITSFDPLTGKTLEAFWPPPNDKRIRRKKVAAGKKKAKPPVFESERYDFYEYHGITDPDKLLTIAQSAWEARSIQELGGQLRTVEMFVDTVSKDPFDLLSLRAGDNVQVEIDRYDRETLRSLGSQDKQREYLLDRGYSPDAARLIIRNMNAMGQLDATFHATKVQLSLEASGDAGKFEVAINFQNRIKLTG